MGMVVVFFARRKFYSLYFLWEHLWGISTLAVRVIPLCPLTDHSPLIVVRDVGVVVPADPHVPAVLVLGQVVEIFSEFSGRFLILDLPSSKNNLPLHALYYITEN